MSIDVRDIWLRSLEMHERAARCHDVAAGLYERFGDVSTAAVERERAARERRAYAVVAARHPEWAPRAGDRRCDDATGARPAAEAADAR